MTCTNVKKVSIHFQDVNSDWQSGMFVAEVHYDKCDCTFFVGVKKEM